MLDCFPSCNNVRAIAKREIMLNHRPSHFCYYFEAEEHVEIYHDIYLDGRYPEFRKYLDTLREDTHE